MDTTTHLESMITSGGRHPDCGLELYNNYKIVCPSGYGLSLQTIDIDYNFIPIIDMPCTGLEQGLSHLCIQHVIRTFRTLFFDSLDTQKFRSGFAEDRHLRVGI